MSRGKGPGSMRAGRPGHAWPFWKTSLLCNDPWMNQIVEGNGMEDGIGLKAENKMMHRSLAQARPIRLRARRLRSADMNELCYECRGWLVRQLYPGKVEEEPWRYVW